MTDSDSALGNVNLGQTEVMRLTSADDAQVLMEVVGYHFADSNLGVDGANWLEIRTEASSGEGNWGFTAPRLTTSEAADLLGWLERVADGVIPVVIDPTEDWRRGTINWTGVCDFIKPCFSLSLAAQSPTHRVIRVHFSHEGLPPWIDAADIGCDLHRFLVRLDMEVGDLGRAIDEWRREIAVFPPRPGSA